MKTPEILVFCKADRFLSPNILNMPEYTSPNLPEVPPYYRHIAVDPTMSTLRGSMVLVILLTVL